MANNGDGGVCKALSFFWRNSNYVPMVLIVFPPAPGVVIGDGDDGDREVFFNLVLKRPG